MIFRLTGVQAFTAISLNNLINDQYSILIMQTTRYILKTSVVCILPLIYSLRFSLRPVKDFIPVSVALNDIITVRLIHRPVYTLVFFQILPVSSP